MKCPNCNYQHQPKELPATECPECGIVYAKYYQRQAAQENKIRTDRVENTYRRADYFDWSSVPSALLGLAFGWAVLFAPGEGLVIGISTFNFDQQVNQEVASKVMVEVLDWKCSLSNGFVNFEGRIRNVSSYKLQPDVIGKLVVSGSVGGIRLIGHSKTSLVSGQTQSFFGQTHYFGQIERCVIERIETPSGKRLGFSFASE
ncbi:MAG: hypothetical protein ACU84J_12470 [Gammaproteobacteria bacterium]